LLYPSPGDPSALFQPVEQGIERGHVELQHVSGAVFDQLADLISMSRAMFDQRKDQQLRAALLQFPVEDLCFDMCHGNISYCDSWKSQPCGARLSESPKYLDWIYVPRYIDTNGNARNLSRRTRADRSAYRKAAPEGVKGISRI